MSDSVYRIIDANSNRIGEGLRVLEDTARFVLNNTDLSSRLKKLRHHIIGCMTTLGDALLSPRDSDNDLGPSIEAKSKHTDLSGLIAANCKRIEQALRSIEELAKLPELSDKLDAAEICKARFTVYSIEREIHSLLARYFIAKKITGVYAIIDTNLSACEDIQTVVESVIKGGATTVQLRDSRHGKGRKYDIAVRIKEICLRYGTLFIVNNDLDIALAADSDGIHIGQDDLPLPVVRKLLPVNKIIGCSTHNIEQALLAEQQNADYIGVGSVFPTLTKEDITVIGSDVLRSIRARVCIPVVAIGGINSQNITQVIEAGADAVAVISALYSCGNIEEATTDLARRFIRNEG